MPADCNQDQDLGTVGWVIVGSVIFLAMLLIFQLARKIGMTWKICFDIFCDCSCSGCECPDRCPFGHRTANGDEEIAMEEGTVHSNGTNGQVNGSNNHCTGYTAVDAPRIDHHDDEIDSIYSFSIRAAEEEPLL